MGEVMTIPMEMRSHLQQGLEDTVTLIGLLGRASDDLAPQTKQFTVSVLTLVERMTRRAISRKTAKEFEDVRTEVFPFYFRLMAATSAAVLESVPSKDLEGLLNESCSHIDAELRSAEALSRLGERLRDQAVFTTWILRKTAPLLIAIRGNHPVEDSKETDREIGHAFSFWSSWSQFHLDCLLTALRCDTAVHPEVSETIMDGLRAAVNAYSLARQGYDLRFPTEEPETPPYIFDEEERELLDSSMRDLSCEDA